MSPEPVRWDGDDLLLDLWVQPRAARDELIGRQGDAWKVRITAPPVEGKANSHLLRWLADLFDVPRARVILASGSMGRRKQVRVKNPGRIPALLLGTAAEPDGAAPRSPHAP